jgi:hypothetical protein
MKTTKTKLRKIIRKVLQESAKLGFAETIDRNKPYIQGDPSLYYWLKQNGNPISIADYSTDPVSMPAHYIDLIKTEAVLQGAKCIGTITSWSRNTRIILFSDTPFTKYIIVFQNHRTQALDTIAEIPVDIELLVQIVDYIRYSESGNPVLDKYII